MCARGLAIFFLLGQWLVACSAPCPYLIQCWFIIVDRTCLCMRRRKLHLIAKTRLKCTSFRHKYGKNIFTHIPLKLEISASVLKHIMTYRVVWHNANYLKIKKKYRSMSRIAGSSAVCSTTKHIKALHYWHFMEGKIGHQWGFFTQRASNTERVPRVIT